MIIRNKLRELRARYRMTQEDLAKKVGVTRQTIIAIENGKYLPSLRLAFKLARVFDMKIDDLFYLEETTFNEKEMSASDNDSYDLLTPSSSCLISF